MDPTRTPVNKSQATRGRLDLGRLWRAVTDTIVTIAAVAVAAAVIVSVRQDGRTDVLLNGNRTPHQPQHVEPPLPPVPIPLKGAALKGNPAAKVALLEFADYQCPYCAAFARDTFPQVEKTFVDSGRALFAFIPFPLPVHPDAERAAEAAECAGKQGRFWQVHEAFFRDPAQLDEDHLRATAVKAGLDKASFDRCLSGDATAIVQEDLALGRAVTISGTPTFFIGTVQPDGTLRATRRFTGTVPMSELARELDRLLNSTK